MASYEIEIKSLLGSSENAEKLRASLKAIDPATKVISRHKQLNHYFVGGDVTELAQSVAPHLQEDDREKLEKIIEQGKDFSVRTRLADEKLLMVLKASLDEGTSHNTVTRLEFEAAVVGMTLQELDDIILGAGFTYQAKWSREREEYLCRDVTVCLDKNAGYGYLAEFEKVVEEKEKLEKTREELHSFMEEVGAEELSQARLERMFAFYNAHWPEYYGTENIFVVE